MLCSAEVTATKGLSMSVVEYRHYELAPGKQYLTRQYVRECSEPNFRRHGFRMTGPWEVIAGATNSLHYLLEWDDFDARERAWEAFYADEEYQKERTRFTVDGELALRANVSFWRPMP